MKIKSFKFLDDYPLRLQTKVIENNPVIYNKIIDLLYLYDEILNNDPLIGNGDILRFKVFLKDLYFYGIL